MCAHLVHERDQGQGVWMAVAADTEEERAHEKATPGALQIKTSWRERMPLTQPRRTPDVKGAVDALAQLRGEDETR